MIYVQNVQLGKSSVLHRPLDAAVPPNGLKPSIKLHSCPSSKAEPANELAVAALSRSAICRGMTWVKSF